jgi:hypothetical protein
MEGTSTVFRHPSKDENRVHGSGEVGRFGPNRNVTCHVEWLPGSPELKRTTMSLKWERSFEKAAKK